MTLSCWHQDPAHRPTMAGVVGFLREWLVFSLFMEQNFLHTSCSYTLRAANPSSSTLAPWRPAGKVDDVINHAPISLVPTNEKPAAPQPSGISQHPGQPSSPHEVPTRLDSIFDVPHSGISENSYGPLCESLSDETRVPSDSGNSDGVHSLRRRRPS